LRNLLTLLAIFTPSAASAQTFVVGTNPADLPGPVYHGQQAPSVPAPVFNAPPLPMPHPAQSGGFSISGPIYNGQQNQSVPMPVQNGYAPPLPAPFYNGDGQTVGVPMPQPVQSGSFTIPGPVYNGGFSGSETPSESYRNEIDGYRSIGQSSPVLGNQSYGTYEPRAAPQQGFTIGAAPRVVFVPLYAPQPYVAPAQRRQFTLPQSQSQPNVYSSCWQGFGSCVNAVGNAVSAIQNTAPYQIANGTYNAGKVVTYGTACSVTFGLTCGQAIHSFGNVVQSADWLSRNVGSPRDYIVTLFGP
jgi:hypothetical protein